MSTVNCVICGTDFIPTSIIDRIKLHPNPGPGTVSRMICAMCRAYMDRLIRIVKLEFNGLIKIDEAYVPATNNIRYVFTFDTCCGELKHLSFIHREDLPNIVPVNLAHSTGIWLNQKVRRRMDQQS